MFDYLFETNTISKEKKISKPDKEFIKKMILGSAKSKLKQFQEFKYIVKHEDLFLITN